jgi:hypothetical protein
MKASNTKGGASVSSARISLPMSRRLSGQNISCHMRPKITYQHCIDPTVISWEERQNRTAIEAEIESARTGMPVPTAGSFCGTTLPVPSEYNPCQRRTNRRLALSEKWWRRNPKRWTPVVLFGVNCVPFVGLRRRPSRARRHQRHCKVAGIDPRGRPYPVVEEAGVDLPRKVDVAVVAWKGRCSSVCYLDYDRDHRRCRRMEASLEGGAVVGRTKIRIREGAFHYCLLCTAAPAFFSSLFLWSLKSHMRIVSTGIVSCCCRLVYCIGQRIPPQGKN